MKKLSVILISIVFLGALTLNAQMHQGSNQQQGMMSGSGMMQGGMMQNMMQGNMMGSGMMGSMGSNMMGQHMIMGQHMMIINRLPYMKTQLSLTQDQQSELIDIWSSFKKQQVMHQTDLARENTELQNLLNNNGSADEVKSQMENYYDVKTEMNAAAYETLKDMKDVLNDDQKDNLQNMMMNQGGMMPGNMQQQERNNMMNRGNNQ